MTEGARSPWSRPTPGEAPVEVGFTTPGAPDVLESPRPVAVPPLSVPVPMLPPSVGERHPADPDETPSSKAYAVLALGVVGLLLMFCGGGLAAGLAGLALARPARDEIAAAAGYLTGGRALRAGEIMSWIAVAVSAIVIVVVVIGLLIGSVGNGPQYDENVN